jgi:hypothetical protein
MSRRALRTQIIMALLVTLLGATPKPAAGAQLEKLLMPGPVVAAHAKLEENCGNCHDLKKPARQTALCLDCHKDIAADLAAARGAHGRMPNAAKSECRACHTEHKGRAGDIVNFSPPGFDHAGTDFPLLGGHAPLPCGACHRTGEPYRKAATACVSCHKANDVHQGGLGQHCQACHDAGAWQRVRFDHDTTHFALRDAHAKVACEACHIGARYKDTPSRCVACHTPDDVHARSRGDDCAKCHTVITWRTAKFDHAKDAGFPLNGAHGNAACGACHSSPTFQDKPPRDCNGCHRAQDAHEGRFGSACASCHDEVHWKPAGFDHAKSAKYALNGAHARLECHTCHTAEVALQKLGTECFSCHSAQDPHGGKLNRACDACHGNETWQGGLRFDHDLTKYPLLGQHVIVSCAQCHTSMRFAGAPTACASCHKTQDVHQGSLGQDCGACHSPAGWKLWEFDHGKQSGFELTGAHRRVECSGCHREPADKVKLSAECDSCHAKDDVHVGEFGRQCQRCHNTRSFAAARTR